MRIKHLPFLLYVADCWAESPTYILVSHPDYSKPHLTSPTKGRNKSCRSGNCLTNKKREFCNYKIPALFLYYIVPSPEFLNSPLLIKKFYPQLHFVTHTGSHNSFLVGSLCIPKVEGLGFIYHLSYFTCSLTRICMPYSSATTAPSPT